MGQAAMKCRDTPLIVGDFENLIVEAVFPGAVASKPMANKPMAAPRFEAAGAVASKPMPREGCHPNAGPRLDKKIQELFALQDLRGDGRLDEEELVRLNELIAMLHYGRDIDRAALKAKYRRLFREQLDPNGAPVVYATFRRYVLQVLNEVDPDDIVAQEMIIEQFISEATSARELLRRPSFCSDSDLKMLPETQCRNPLVVLEPILTAVVI